MHTDEDLCKGQDNSPAENKAERELLEAVNHSFQTMLDALQLDFKKIISE